MFAFHNIHGSVYINNKAYTTNSKGQVKMLINNAVPKTYTYKLSFKGKDNYVASSASVKVTIKKATPKFIAKAKAFKLADQTKKICCDFQGQ